MIPVLLFIAATACIIFAALRVADRRLDRILATFNADIERDRQARIQAGFDAGSHEATR